MVNPKSSIKKTENVEVKTRVFVVEKIFIVLLSLIVLDTIIKIQRYRLSLLFVSLLVPIVLLVLIIVRFTIESKAKISFIVGIIGTLYSLFVVLNFFIFTISFSFNLVSFRSYLLPITLMSIFGLIYGIIGLKSLERSLAKFGIILNILSLLSIYSVMFIVFSLLSTVGLY